MTNPFDAVEKPTLLLDETAARRNIHRMAERARAAGIRFRPHFKTHQSAEIGGWFRQEGVTAITTSSIDMALYFASAGWDDITIAFPVNVRQAAALNDLASRVRLGLLVESVEAAQILAERLHAPADIWLKIDTGTGRTGIAWDDLDSAEAVARAVCAHANFRLRGLLTHAGNTYGATGADEVCRRAGESAARMNHMRDGLNERGISSLEVSVGDTPSTSLCVSFGNVDEIRPGNFVFYDAQQARIGSCGWQDVAVALACPVVAVHPERGEATVHGGAVHLSTDFLLEDDGTKIFGRVCLPDGSRWSDPIAGAVVARLSQEHGILRLPPEVMRQVQVGGLVCVIPPHSCLSVTLMKRYLTLEGRLIDTLNVEK